MRDFTKTVNWRNLKRSINRDFVRAYPVFIDILEYMEELESQIMELDKRLPPAEEPKISLREHLDNEAF